MRLQQLVVGWVRAIQPACKDFMNLWSMWLWRGLSGTMGIIRDYVYFILFLCITPYEIHKLAYVLDPYKHPTIATEHNLFLFKTLNPFKHSYSHML